MLKHTHTKEEEIFSMLESCLFNLLFDLAMWSIFEPPKTATLFIPIIL